MKMIIWKLERKETEKEKPEASAETQEQEKRTGIITTWVKETIANEPVRVCQSETNINM